MRDLILEILISLIIAAIIGFVIGWLLKHLFCRSKLASLEAGWSTKHTALERDAGDLRGQLADRDAAIAKLEASAGEGSEADLRAELTKAEARLLDMDRDLDQCQSDLEACRAARAETPSSDTPPPATPPPAPAAPEAAAPAAAGERPAWLMSSPSEGEPDDLKSIWGVGPVLEKTMNNLGIYYYRQVAKFTGPDIVWVAENINAFPDRIERDKWVEQAHDLHTKKYGSAP